MRYARAAVPLPAPPAGGSARPAWRRPVPLAVAAVVAGGAALGIGLGATGGGTPVERTPAARAVAAAFVEANALFENLGAPAPAGLPAASAAWALRSVPLVGGSGGRGHLARSEHRWIGPAGSAVPLDRSTADRLVAAQAAEVRAHFTGAARAEVLGELAALVAGEQRRPPAPASPGGARVTQWYVVAVHGDRARADAVVTEWGQHDTIVGPPGHQRVAAQVVTDAVDANAVLVRRGGRWLVASWTRAPWQQPT